MYQGIQYLDLGDCGLFRIDHFHRFPVRSLDHWNKIVQMCDQRSANRGIRFLHAAIDSLGMAICHDTTFLTAQGIPLAT